jgi:hypothetical protein
MSLPVSCLRETTSPTLAMIFVVGQLADVSVLERT